MKRLRQYDTYLVPATDIVFDAEFNCRGAFSPQSVGDLAQSIKDHGLQTPVTVRPAPADKYLLLAGHRRFEAMTVLLKWLEIPSIVRDDLTEHQARIFNLTENLERKDLNMMEEALAVQKLYPDGVSLRQAARELKRPTRWVQCRLKLLTLTTDVQKWASTGHLSALNIELLSKLEGSRQSKAVNDIVTHKQQHGKTRAMASRYQRKFKGRKTKSQLAKMVEHLYNVNCDGLACRILAWSAGRITDFEIEEDLRNEPNYRDPGPDYDPPYADCQHKQAKE